MRLKKGERRFVTDVSRGRNGFARVAGSAVSPDLLERVLLQRNDSLPPAQARGLAALDRLAAPGGDLDQLVSRRSAWLVNYADDKLQFALGLDQATTVGKLRAIVARAYLRGWRYADKAGATHAAMGRAAGHEKVLREALAQMTFGRTFGQGGGWTGPEDFACVNWERESLGDILDDFHLMRWEGQSEMIERRWIIAEAFEVLATMHQSMKHLSTSQGRPPHEELFFLAVCLGEAFTILTGLKPIFDHVRRVRSNGLDWRGFLDAAFVLCGLASQLPDKAFKPGGYKAVKDEDDEHDFNEGMPGDLLTDKLRLGPPRKEGALHTSGLGISSGWLTRSPNHRAAERALTRGVCTARLSIPPALISTMKGKCRKMANCLGIEEARVIRRSVRRRFALVARCMHEILGNGA